MAVGVDDLAALGQGDRLARGHGHGLAGGVDHLGPGRQGHGLALDRRRRRRRHGLVRRHGHDRHRAPRRDKRRIGGGNKGFVGRRRDKRRVGRGHVGARGLGPIQGKRVRGHGPRHQRHLLPVLEGCRLVRGRLAVLGRLRRGRHDRRAARHDAGAARHHHGGAADRRRDHHPAGPRDGRIGALAALAGFRGGCRRRVPPVLQRLGLCAAPAIPGGQCPDRRQDGHQSPDRIASPDTPHARLPIRRFRICRTWPSRYCSRSC